MSRTNNIFRPIKKRSNVVLLTIFAIFTLCLTVLSLVYSVKAQQPHQVNLLMKYKVDFYTNVYLIEMDNKEYLIGSNTQGGVSVTQIK